MSPTTSRTNDESASKGQQQFIQNKNLSETRQFTERMVIQKNMVMGSTGFRTKNNYAGKDQQQVT
jgi:hypothetical protein